MVALNQNAVKSSFGTNVRSRSYAFRRFCYILGQRVNRAVILKGASFMIVPQFLFFVVRWQRAWVYLAISTLLFSFFLVACSDSSPGGNSNSGPPVSSPSSPQVALAQLHWCGKPVMLFRDEGAPTAMATGSLTPTSTATGTPTATATASATATPPVAGTPKTITDWAQVEPNLGFTVYLPATLPQHSCLVSALGTIHDPIFGGSFTIGYLLPDHSSISLAEAPLRGQSTQFQCNVSTTTAALSAGSTGAEFEMDTKGLIGAPQASPKAPTAKSSVSPTPTQTPDQICSGVMDTTNIIFSARGTTESLQKFFNALEPHVNWIPAS